MQVPAWAANIGLGPEHNQVEQFTLRQALGLAGKYQTRVKVTDSDEQSIYGTE